MKTISKFFKQRLFRNDCPKLFDPYKRLIAVTVITGSVFHCMFSMYHSESDTISGQRYQ